MFRRKWKMTYIPKWKHSLWVPANLSASYILTYKDLPMPLLGSASCFIQKGEGIRAGSAHNVSPFYFLAYIFSQLLPFKTHHGAPDTVLTTLKPQAINRPSSLLSLISPLQQIPLCLFSPRNMVNTLHPRKPLSSISQLLTWQSLWMYCTPLSSPVIYTSPDCR